MRTIKKPILTSREYYEQVKGLSYPGKYSKIVPHHTAGTDEMVLWIYEYTPASLLIYANIKGTPTLFLRGSVITDLLQNGHIHLSTAERFFAEILIGKFDLPVRLIIDQQTNRVVMHLPGGRWQRVSEQFLPGYVPDMSDRSTAQDWQTKNRRREVKQTLEGVYDPDGDITDNEVIRL